MFKFLSVVSSALSSIALKKDQWLYDSSSEQFYADIDIGGTVVRKQIKGITNTVGSTDSNSKLYLVGTTSQMASAQSYSQDSAYVNTDGHLYSNSKQVVNLSDTQALTNKTINGYTPGAAMEKGVDTTLTTSSTSTNLPTSAAVAALVNDNLTFSVSGGHLYVGS